MKRVAGATNEEAVGPERVVVVYIVRLELKREIDDTHNASLLHGGKKTMT